MKKILLTGMPGSGKSTIGVELNKRNFNTIDTDDLSHWVDWQGVPITDRRPANTPTEWLESHAWVWNKEKIQYLFNQSDKSRLILCGYSWDLANYYSSFDTIILLSFDQETIRERLLNRNNGNMFGKGEHEITFLQERLERFQYSVQAAGAIVIDAHRPLEVVVEDIAKLLSEL